MWWSAAASQDSPPATTCAGAASTTSPTTRSATTADQAPANPAATDDMLASQPIGYWSGSTQATGPARRHPHSSASVALTTMPHLRSHSRGDAQVMAGLRRSTRTTSRQTP
ncbi:hypothetical protein B5180_12440 [Streptomyces sp. BF-3]|nr:hypothetical protein B5180_12440 [Streptomyces sp. BF-3]